MIMVIFYLQSSIFEVKSFGFSGDKKHQQLANQLSSLAAALRANGLHKGKGVTPLELTAAQFGVSSSSSKHTSSDEAIVSPKSGKKRKIDTDKRIESSLNNK